MISSAGKSSGGIDYSKWDHLDYDSSNDGSGEGINEAEDALVPSSAREDRSEQNIGEDDLSNAERLLLMKGISYEKDSDGWLKFGKIRLHPDDDVKLLPPAIFDEDPRTFTPDASEFVDGIVTKWGLQDAPALRDPSDASENIEMMMNRVMLPSKLQSLYGSGDNAIVQFIKVLEKRKLKFVDRDPSVQASLHLTYVIKISLCECSEDVWRRVRVPAAIDLSKLHDQVIVPVMGWSRGYHGYVFEDPKDGTTIGPVKYSGYIDMMHVPIHYYHLMDDKSIPLAAILRSRDDFLFYTYDLGDQWNHRIELEEVIDGDEGSVVLLDGAGACPPEDSNGLEGKGCGSFAEFLAGYKKHPKKLQMKEAIRDVQRNAQNYSSPWLGSARKFKPLEFDVEYHRSLLAAMVAGPSVKKAGYAGDSSFKESMSGCANCGNRLKALMKCSKCSRVAYCSKECQVDHWKNGGHKKKCKELRCKK